MPGDPLLCAGGPAFLKRCLRTPFREETTLLSVRKIPFLEVSPILFEEATFLAQKTTFDDAPDLAPDQKVARLFYPLTAPDPEVLAVVDPAQASSSDQVPDAHSLLWFPENLFPVQELPFPHK